MSENIWNDGSETCRITSLVWQAANVPNGEICVIASYTEIWHLDMFINEGAIGRSEKKKNGLRINKKKRETGGGLGR